ncbi:MAG: biotin/lipoyl-binding protein [Chloroflexi bacterium]|nr:biotin/lipoyl-binding protein [Chloroflexota bacterium]
MSSRNYKITIAGQTYNVEVGDVSSSPVEVVVDGVSYTVELPESESPRVQASTIPAAPRPSNLTPQPVARPAVPTTGGDGVVRAPMPGRIIRLNVSVGDSVTPGQPLFVLESMKMENTITAPVGGTVSTVLVSAGDSVQHGQSLAEIARA